MCPELFGEGGSRAAAAEILKCYEYDHENEFYILFCLKKTTVSDNNVQFWLIGLSNSVTVLLFDTF